MLAIDFILNICCIDAYKDVRKPRDFLKNFARTEEKELD